MNNSLQQEVIATQETEFAGSTQSKQKMIIHFTSGETMEVQDSVEEEEQPSNSPPFREPTDRNWFSFKNVAILVGRISLHACDFLGERLASALGLNAPKYQSLIDQYQHDHKEPSSQASGGLKQGQGEMTRFSQMDGSQYGATGHISRPADLQGSHDEKHMSSKDGYHNRSYQANEDYLK
ncbi:protein FAM177A1 [Hippoglossus hippoglossus]|uniref:protein FAM177A1 n=1 Tax=Hippoglossus hippoglossus TaxID=8267 RepID=UPI00148B7C84|nr:protein FAM177A1 [Hippoglossus hippoglossus]XP_035000336.1 protein FAM177A1 [Hippoglossus stenolepis]